MTEMQPAEDSLKRAEELLGRLEQTRAKLEATEDPDVAIEVMQELAEIAKAVEAAIEDARRESDANA
jgi:hypothetical protein